MALVLWPHREQQNHIEVLKDNVENTTRPTKKAFGKDEENDEEAIELSRREEDDFAFNEIVKFIEHHKAIGSDVESHVHSLTNNRQSRGYSNDKNSFFECSSKAMSSGIFQTLFPLRAGLAFLRETDRATEKDSDVHPVFIT
ncbi:hypothetical protein CBL_03934 [Carabus blaptoides fortunei]